MNACVPPFAFYQTGRMTTVLNNLLKATGRALLLLGQFLLILLLGLLAALLFTLPWLIRLACVLIWFMGEYWAVRLIQELYAPNSPAGAVLALQFASIFLMAAWAGTLLLVKPQHLWGGLALGGLFPAWSAWQGIPWLWANWQYTGLFFRALPPALFSLTLIYITIRMRLLRNAQQLHLSGPAFIWLPEQLQNLRGNHERTNSNQHHD